MYVKVVVFRNSDAVNIKFVSFGCFYFTVGNQKTDYIISNYTDI